MGTTLTTMADSIQTHEDFVRFVRELKRDFERAPDGWENDRLDTFLEAMASWAADMDGYFANRGETVPQVPTWRLMAQLLLAARIYE